MTRAMILAVALVAVSSSARAEPSAPVEDPPERWSRLPTTALLSVEAGPIARAAYGEGLFTGILGVTLGAQDARWGGGLYLEGGYGATLYGLRTGTFGGGPRLEFRTGARWRFEFVFPTFDFSFIQRVTEPYSLLDLRIGMWLAATYDIVQNDDGALFVSLRAGPEVSLADSSGGGFAAITIGYRTPFRRPDGR